MSTVNLPLTFHAVGIQQLNTPFIDLQRTISSLTPDQLLVRISHSSINPMDIKVVARNSFHYPLPLVPGGDFSGIVVAVGGPTTEVDDPIAVGSEVFGMAWGLGCFAEFAVVSRQLTAVRGSIPAKEAGAYTGAFITAFDSLEVVGQMSGRKGQVIYIAGAGGGVGHFAAQLAKMRGLTVIGSASKPEALQLLQQLKVDHVIDYARQDVVKEVLALTEGRGADVVYDPTYSLSSYTQSAACVAAGGVWIKLGLHMHTPGSEAIAKIAEERGATVLLPSVGSYFAPGKESSLQVLTRSLHQAVQWYERGSVRVYVSRTIDCTPEALQRAFTGFDQINVGKVAVQIAPESTIGQA